MHPPAVLAKYIERAGLRQNEFARKAGIAESLLSHYIAGARRPGLKNASGMDSASGGEVPASIWIGFQPRKKSPKRHRERRRLDEMLRRTPKARPQP